MLEFESKEQPSVRFWVSDQGHLCIEQESPEFGQPVTILLGPDAVDLLAANLELVAEKQKKTWYKRNLG